MNENEFMDYLIKRKKRCEESGVCEYLTGIFHSKLLTTLLLLSGISAKKKTRELSEADMLRFVRRCKHTVLSIQDTNGFEHAQVCAGGVCLSEVDCRTMESRLIDGLYLTGELLDADGMCGGYNLQWAWATGYLAGKHAGISVISKS